MLFHYRLKGKKFNLLDRLAKNFHSTLYRTYMPTNQQPKPKILGLRFLTQFDVHSLVVLFLLSLLILSQILDLLGFPEDTIFIPPSNFYHLNSVLQMSRVFNFLYVDCDIWSTTSWHKLIFYLPYPAPFPHEVHLWQIQDSLRAHNNRDLIKDIHIHSLTHPFA